MSLLTSSSPSSDFDTATLAGGCFWCLEAVYERVRGVTAVQSGYANGHAPAPTYEAVCRGDTGYAEAVRITFDPAVISYRNLLEIFFAIHDPTTLNRQGADVGEQYRSAIFTHDGAQERIAHDLVSELTAAGDFDAPIVTRIEPLINFFAAEPYHDHYFARHPEQGYCAYVIGPKVHKFRQKFSQWLTQ